MDNRELYHYGVKGMKWGVIRENLRQRRAKSQEKAEERREKRVRAGKVSVKKMTDAEIRARMDRLNLERSYIDLVKGKTPQQAVQNQQTIKRGESATTRFLKESGKKIFLDTSVDLAAQFVKYKAVNKINDKLGDNNALFTNNKRK